MFNSKGTAEAILAKAASQISPFLGGEGPRQEGPDKPRGGPHHHHQSPGEPGMVKARRQLSQRCRLVEPTNFWKEERWQRESLEPRDCDGGCRQGRAGEVAMEWCGWSPAVAGPGAGEVGSARACARVTWWAGPARGDRGALPHGLGKKSIPAPPGVPGQTIQGPCGVAGHPSQRATLVAARALQIFSPHSRHVPWADLPLRYPKAP